MNTYTASKELHIQFKTKPFKVIQDDNGAFRMAIDFKKTLTRADCNMCPQDHDHYNSDLFPSMLNGLYKRVIDNAKWSYLDSLPLGVHVDTSKFLAVVTIQIARNFKPTR